MILTYSSETTELTFSTVPTGLSFCDLGTIGSVSGLSFSDSSDSSLIIMLSKWGGGGRMSLRVFGCCPCFSLMCLTTLCLYRDLNSQMEQLCCFSFLTCSWTSSICFSRCDGSEVKKSQCGQTQSTKD